MNCNCQCQLVLKNNVRRTPSRQHTQNPHSQGRQNQIDIVVEIFPDNNQTPQNDQPSPSIQTFSNQPRPKDVQTGGVYNKPVRTGQLKFK